MDSSDWKTLNTHIRIVDTKKKFYNQFFYCIKYRCPGARIILNQKNQDLHAAVTRRLDFEKTYHYNYGGSWFHKKNGPDIDAEQLIALRSVKEEFGKLIKIRIEEPNVIIYSSNEELLNNIATGKMSPWINELLLVSKPRNEEIKQYLEKGCVVVQRPSIYKYKFVCKSGTCRNKRAIADYLYQLEEVKISDAIWTLLENTTHDYIWNVWFYANDPDIAHMLNIIEPNFVTNIHEVVLTQ